MTSINDLPDSTECYVPGLGVTTLGEIRASRAIHSLSDEAREWEATLQMWEDVATRNLCRGPGERAVSRAEIKEEHRARFAATGSR